MRGQAMMLWLCTLLALLALLLTPTHAADTGQGTLGYEWRLESWLTEGYTRSCASTQVSYSSDYVCRSCNTNQVGPIYLYTYIPIKPTFYML
jgi:hypothetical protein